MIRKIRMMGFEFSGKTFLSNEQSEKSVHDEKIETIKSGYPIQTPGVIINE